MRLVERPSQKNRRRGSVPAPTCRSLSVRCTFPVGSWAVMARYCPHVSNSRDTSGPWRTKTVRERTAKGCERVAEGRCRVPYRPPGTPTVYHSPQDVGSPKGAAKRGKCPHPSADLVNAAYGLTPEEVALMWGTAPPRMPGEPPAASRRATNPASRHPASESGVDATSVLQASCGNRPADAPDIENLVGPGFVARAVCAGVARNESIQSKAP